MTEEPTIPEPIVTEDGLTAEQVAGRMLVDLTVDELQELAVEPFDIEGAAAMTKTDLIVALGGDPDAMDQAAREAAAAALAEREAAEVADHGQGGS